MSSKNYQKLYSLLGKYVQRDDKKEFQKFKNTSPKSKRNNIVEKIGEEFFEQIKDKYGKKIKDPFFDEKFLAWIYSNPKNRAIYGIFLEIKSDIEDQEGGCGCMMGKYKVTRGGGCSCGSNPYDDDYRGGMKGILKIPGTPSPKKGCKVNFDQWTFVAQVPNNDCPKNRRVRMYKKVDEDGVRVRLWACPPNMKEYQTKNGQRCCKKVEKIGRFKIEEVPDNAAQLGGYVMELHSINNKLNVLGNKLKGGTGKGKKTKQRRMNVDDLLQKAEISKKRKKELDAFMQNLGVWKEDTTLKITRPKKVSFGDVEVKFIPGIDCPKERRPHMEKNGHKKCYKGEGMYITKNGFECCREAQQLYKEYLKKQKLLKKLVKKGGYKFDYTIN